MSRSGYSDDCDNLGLWRGAVDRATFGRRGQAFLRKLRDALDALPSKRLIADSIKNESGEVCALGAVDANAPDYEAVELAEYFGIAHALAAEIMYMNDERFGGEWGYVEGPAREPESPRYERRGVWTFITYSPEERYRQMRAWVEKQIGPDDPETPNV